MFIPFMNWCVKNNFEKEREKEKEGEKERQDCSLIKFVLRFFIIKYTKKLLLINILFLLLAL